MRIYSNSHLSYSEIIKLDKQAELLLCWKLKSNRGVFYFCVMIVAGAIYKGTIVASEFSRGGMVLKKVVKDILTEY